MMTVMDKFDPLGSKGFSKYINLSRDPRPIAMAAVTLIRETISGDFLDRTSLELPPSVAPPVRINWDRTPIHETRLPGEGWLGAWAFEARIVADRIAIDLSVQLGCHPDRGYGYLVSVLMHFQDLWHWEEPESERIAGATMRNVDLFLSPPPDMSAWRLAYGGWRHGVFFPCDRDPLRAT
jgi:hypothetical protein